MSDDLQIVTPAEREELEPHAQILSICFGTPIDAVHTGLERTGLSNIRMVRAGGRIVGGLSFIPMAQWFGGRSVETIGIAGVGVDPAYRSSGVASFLMQSAARELSERGVALSTLYPATVPLYRKAGYEIAGTRHQITMPIGALHVPRADDGLDVRLAEPADHPAMEAAYSRYASTFAGLLDRGPYVWERTRQPGGQTARHYLVTGADGIEAYASLVHDEGGDDSMYDLQLSDVVVSSAAAGHRLLRLFASHRSLAEKVVWHGSPSEPLLQIQPDWRTKLELKLCWMLRIIDMGEALLARGYPHGLDAELHLAVYDDVLPHNARRWLLTLDGGRPRVEEGGQGLLEIDVRGLAALYSGFQPAAALTALGKLRGPTEELARASAVFAGPAPWMPDMF